jgi:hypothetical protein
MAAKNNENITLRERIEQVAAYLSTLAELLTARGLKVGLSSNSAIPTLSAIDPRSGRNGGSVVVDSDAWIECIWAPAQDADPAHTADVIVSVLRAICPAETADDDDEPTRPQHGRTE